VGELVRSFRDQPGALLGVVPFVLLMAIPPLFLNAYGVQVLMIGLYYVVLAVSWNILAGYTGQFSLAQHAFALLGGYASAAAALALGLPLAISIVVAVVASALLGYALGWVTLGMRGIYFAISTWAFAESVRILLSINYQITRGDMGLPVPYLFETPDPFPYYYVFLVAAVGAVLLNVAMLRMKIGYRMRAIRDDQELALASGIDVVKWKRITFMISTALAGLAGALYGHSVGLLIPNQAHFSQMAFIIIAVVLGGFRTIWGPVIGALVIQGLSELLRVGVEWRMVIFAMLVILVVRVYPPGIMGLASILARRVRRRDPPSTTGQRRPAAALPKT
jgi:branched-chain amino acid transport system permease protein